MRTIKNYEKELWLLLDDVAETEVDISTSILQR